MATKAKSSSSSCLSFLKDALLLPTQNAKLFVPVFLLIIAFFATSTTYAGDRYSLPELFTEVIMKGRRLRGPLITVAMVGVLNVACILLLVALLQLAMSHMGGALHGGPLRAPVPRVPVPQHRLLRRHSRVGGRRGPPRRERAHAGVAADDTGVEEGRLRAGRRGPTGGDGSIPLHAVALAWLKKSMPMGLALLSVYALLSGLVQLFYYAAAMVYYYQAMESKEVMAHDYVKIPTGEATV
ncbi:unnamed protein product [Miscanthus lutarioriparius]|uniref:Uncharacterized protein n=1 Tax=Miscanthus lutarioriparius TaxID=422564 RepID=A0A811S6P3_9POAL|nr:unnamed protein product [Miscanthus lutarioriparius]